MRSAAGAGGVGEDAVHRGGEPEDAEPFAERAGGGVGAIEADDAAAGAIRGGAGAEVDRLAGGMGRITGGEVKFGGDGEVGPSTLIGTLFRFGMGGHVDQRGAAQASARREEGDGFEHVGLARAVFAHQQVEACGGRDGAIGVIAEMVEVDAV